MGKKEEPLQDQRFFKSLTDDLPVPIFFKDKKGRITYCNDSFAGMFGLNTEEIIGKTTEEFSPKEFSKIVRQTDHALYRKKGRYEYTAELSPLSTSKKIVTVRKGLVRVGRHTEGIGGVMLDITKQRNFERQLQESENRFKSIFSNSAVAITVADEDEWLISWNSFTEKLLGMKEKDLKGRKINSLYPPEEWAKIKKAGIKQKGYLPHFETQMLKKNGGSIHVDISISTIKDKAGNVTGSIGVIRDISERKRAEERIQESEEKFRSIFENSAVAITLADRDQRIISWNSFTEKLLGRKKKELLSKKISSLYPKEEWAKIKRANISKKGYQHHFETRMIKGNKELIDVDISISVLKDNIGKVTGSIGVIRDISERKEADNRIRESEERFESIFENSAVAITLSDDKERIISWNRFTEQLLERTKKQLRLVSIRSLYPPEEWEKIRGQHIRQKGMQHHLETKMIKGNGQIIDVDISVSVLKDAAGNITGSIGVFRDITERKKAQEKDFLENQLQVKTEFVNRLSHDLRTPLTPITTLLPIVEKRVADEQVKKFVSVCIKNAEYLNDLVNDTLNLARIESGIPFEITKTDIKLVIEEVIEQNKPLFQKFGIKTAISTSGSLVTMADRLRIKEVLENLMMNSAKFMPKGGILTIIGKRQKDDAVLTIKDTGIGIEKKALPHLFKEFYKADESRHELSSSGLGLAICRKIIEKHGGEIFAQSPGKNKGTSVTFTLPIKESFGS